MKILILNAGSSSLKFGIFDMDRDDRRVFKGEFERFGPSGCTLHVRAGGEQAEDQQRPDGAANVSDAIARMPAVLSEFGFTDFQAVGHRVAHGGDRFEEAALIDDAVLEHIRACTPLAPLHNPANLEAITMARTLWPALPQVAVFDTAFHHTIPVRAHTYAVPREWRERGLRRYGFHGTSHKYVALKAAQALRSSVTDLQIISCHLGNGASVCAINRGFSVDTTMGMTALEGLVMGTRSGDVDPGIFAFLHRELGMTAEEVEHSLYTDSGLKALAGSADMRDIEMAAAGGDRTAQQAIGIYAYRVRKYIGAYMAAMGGVDAIVFTGGIGENSASMRRRICDKFEYVGLHLDDDRNEAINLSHGAAPQIQSFESRVKVIVTGANEQLMIAQEVRHLLQERAVAPAPGAWHIPVSVSARHVHLSEPALTALFGPGYDLTKMRDLSQPEAWAANETVDVVGPKGSIGNVRVLGPLRDRTQIEVSMTDTFTLGVEAPVRPSGKLDKTPVIKLRGPAGNLDTDGLIVAARHIHMSPVDAEHMGLKDGQYVNMRLDEGRGETIFANTLVRVKEGFVTEMHIDTNEANAAGISLKTDGELIQGETTKKFGFVGRRNLELAE
ncbi:MAG: acetate/propionate family kinase [Rhodobacterales bacterium]|nr:acetate/propionate family kinase [Rhodobacterales bacterium]